MKQNVRISRKMLQILLDRITSSLSLSIPLKDFKCYGGGGGGGGGWGGGGGGGGRVPISSDEAD